MQVYACCLSIYELWLFPWVGWWFTWLVQHYFLDCTSISSQDRITGIHIAAAKSRHVNVCCIKIDIIEHQRYCQLHATKTIASIKQMILQKIPNSQKSWQNLSWSTRLPFLPLQKSMHGSLGTKQHGYHAISIFSNFLCPCIQSWLPSVWYIFRLPSMLYALSTTPYLSGSHTILPCRLHLLALSDGLLVVPFHCRLLLPGGA